MTKKYDGLEIAIIGISGQFPDSASYRHFWKNLVEGKEMITTYTSEELIQRGLTEAEAENELYVRSEGVVADKDCFDHAFFDYNPNEALLMDPQVRLLHENCWRALEDAGYASHTDKQKIGLFAGASDNENWRMYVYAKANEVAVDPLFLSAISRPNFISTLVSHKLNLRGPSLYVDTLCSTSLTTVHLACRSLLTKECGMALAGGVTINTRLGKGYLYQEGSIKSKDGRTCTFDATSTGTGGGEGIGIVVLKRLNEAMKDGDNIYAIIKSTAINNDGTHKVGYTAPSVKGQAECIKMAQRLAGIDPASISYIEAHGTATSLGDLIEIRALNEAFGKDSSDKFCAIGSVKTNVGHLDRAAGITGLIKTALSIRHKKIPASLHYTEPNPQIDFDGGPFYVNTTLTDWKQKDDQPLRAGVSAFGIGGSNAHAILEEAPPSGHSDKERNYKLLTISAKTEGALRRYIADLKDFMQGEEDLNAADLAYSLQAGRKHFAYRRSVEFKDSKELLELLSSGKLNEHITKSKDRSNGVVFTFSGLGAQYAQMCKDLYAAEPAFKQELDACFDAVKSIAGVDIKAILYPAAVSEASHKAVQEIDTAQYLVFIIEYALAKLLMHWGIKPHAMIGYSFGEYVAACISGVFSMPDAIKIIHKRGSLIKNLPAGAMLSIPLSRNETEALLTEALSLAIDNGTSCVVSGSEAAIVLFENKMKEMKLMCVRLDATRGVHSHMMNPILKELEAFIKTIPLSAPQIPYVSNVTGNWINASDAMTASYWTKQLRNTAEFYKGIKKLGEDEKLVYVEIGPGSDITALVNRELESKAITERAINLIKPLASKVSDAKYFFNKLGKLWSQGVNIDWSSYYTDEKRKRISLPTYSFEPNRYPAEVDPYALFGNGMYANTEKKKNADDWFYRISWKKSVWLPGRPMDYTNKTLLIFAGASELAGHLQKHIALSFANAVLVLKGTVYKQVSEIVYQVNPASENDLEQLFSELKDAGKTPAGLFHLWNADAATAGQDASDHKNGYESLLNIARSFSGIYPDARLHIDVVASGLYAVTGNEALVPARSTSLGAVKIIPQEFQNISCRAIDITDTSEDAAKTLWTELNYTPDTTEVAIRGKNRYTKDFEKTDFKFPEETAVFKTKGTYLVTGANGGMGKAFAVFLAEEFKANLILIGRNAAAPGLIAELEAKGAQVLYILADISDAENVSPGVTEAENRFGTINGIIHTAGTGDFAGLIINRSKADDEKIFAPKLAGTQVLNSMFENKALDFFVHCSSLAASMAPAGQVAYTAANLYQDACAERGNAHYPVISIEWTSLKETGMTVKAAAGLSEAAKSDVFKYSIAPAEAIGVLKRAIYLRIPTQIISTTDFKHLFLSAATAEQEDDALNAGFNFNSVVKKERPDLSTEYTGPNTETEEALQQLFQNFFGISNIGVEDDFFELGGDSLKAMVLLKRIGKELSTEISLKQFLSVKTITGIGAAIDEKAWINKKSEKAYSAII